MLLFCKDPDRWQLGAYTKIGFFENDAIILQIHDELVVEIAPGEAEQVTGLVRDAMEHAVDLAVPLDVSTGIGSDWQLAAH